MIKNVLDYENVIDFFVPLKKIPTVTAQMKRVSVRSGKPVFYADDKLRDAHDLFCAWLSQYKPPKPLEGPLCLFVAWRYLAKGKNKIDTWKTTKPDTDNLIKLFKDCMAEVGYFHNDAQVVYEIQQKYYDDVEGIAVFLAPLKGFSTCN